MNKKIVFKIVSGALLCSMVGYTVPVFAYTKDETVYSKLDNSGDCYRTIVSTHIKNTENEDLIKDMSDLLNIKNTCGDETYTQDGSTFNWNANKNDIYYQGESSKELPIECSVKYELDGEEILPEDIAGKSGKVRIIIQYTNKEDRMVDINGKKVKMYVPFVVVAGTVVKNEVASNVEVSSGKVIDDGTKTIVVGMAMPGLQESLGVSRKDIEIPDNIEIIMDAKNFESNSIVSFVTPKVLDEDDLSIFDKLDDVYAKVNTLETSSKQIENGANTLRDGTQVLSDGTTQLKNGAVSAYEGASQISSEVNKSIKALEADKSDALDKNTLKQIEIQAENSSKFTNEQIQLIIAEADKGIEEKSAMIKAQAVNSAKQIAESTALQTAINVAQSTARQTAIQTATSVAQTAAKQSAIQTAKTLNPNLTSEQLEAIGNQAVASAKLPEEQLNAIGEQAVKKAGLTEEQKKQVIAKADSGIEAQRAIIEAQGVESAKKIAEETAISAAQKGATTAAKTTATTVAGTVANQVKTTASKKVVSQMQVLGNGLNQLKSGLSTLNDGAQSLENGAMELEDGATTLADGIRIFNEDGIEKICDYINGDIRSLATRVEMLTELSKEYNNFTMIDGDNCGEVMFVMVVDGVKVKCESEQSKVEAVIDGDASFDDKD